MSDKKHLAAFLAIDITTTELALAVRDDEGEEGFERLEMGGQKQWRDNPAYPGFDLAVLPGMIGELVQKLAAQGWEFGRDPQSPGYVSVACRQHDQVILDKHDQPLTPAITWQCNAATAEVEQLRAAGVEASVGPLAPRFVLPKLKHVLTVDESLRSKIGRVLLTGDWVAYALTGQARLAKSDALSNGLLDQTSRELATAAIQAAGFDVAWFPAPASSGTLVGDVQPAGSTKDPWHAVKSQLAGWKFAAGLGDNHASAVGCGMTDDYRRMVVSAGTSGTINLSCAKSCPLPPDGKSLRFEFYDRSLFLLQMLADCGAWYTRFFQLYAPHSSNRLADLNTLTLDVDLGDIRRVLHDDGRHFETFPIRWAELSLGAKTACTQFSIMVELLTRVGDMIREVRDSGQWAVDTYVLTGGLSQSRLFQQFFHAGIQLLAPGARAKVSGRTGALRFKTSAYGALVNAELAKVGTLEKIFADTSRFPLLDCAAFDPVRQAQAEYLLRASGLA